ncbi:MAG: hypothetical protein ACTSVI_01930 [Promethearchaeota archaeon]
MMEHGSCQTFQYESGEDLEKRCFVPFLKKKSLIEPYFHEHSILISRWNVPSPVKILNDRSSGLVKLFEMIRVNNQGFFSIIKKIARKNEDECSRFVERCVNDLSDITSLEIDIGAFSSKSPFLKGKEDVSASVITFLRAWACLEKHLPLTFNKLQQFSIIEEFIFRLHQRLESILIENLPVPEIIDRFNRSYSVFHVQYEKLSDFLDETIDTVHWDGFKGSFIISYPVEHFRGNEVIDRLPTNLEKLRPTSVFYPASREQENRVYKCFTWDSLKKNEY